MYDAKNICKYLNIYCKICSYPIKKMQEQKLQEIWQNYTFLKFNAKKQAKFLYKTFASCFRTSYIRAFQRGIKCVNPSWDKYKMCLVLEKYFSQQRKSLCHKYKFSNPNIFATQCRRPQIFQTLNCVRSNTVSLKYQRPIAIRL